MGDSVVDEDTFKSLLERDDYSCLNCNGEDNLHPAHYISRGSGGDNSLPNLMTLCNECHRKHHSGKLVVERLLLKSNGETYYKFFFKERR